jgi:hypothetical protein
MRLPSSPSLSRVPGLAGRWPGLADLANLAAFVRDRLARRGDAPLAVGNGSAAASDRQLEVAFAAAAAPFAPTSYARARLLRQMHASGLLTGHEADQAEQLFGVAQ